MHKMNNNEIRRKAEEHWDWLEPILKLIFTPQHLEIVRYLYITSGVHFAKHQREAQDER